MRDSKHLIKGKISESACLTSIPGNQTLLLDSILTNKTLNISQVIIQDHPPLLTPVVLDDLQFLKQTVISLSRTFTLTATFPRNAFLILLGPTPTSSSVNITSPGEFLLLRLDQQLWPCALHLSSFSHRYFSVQCLSLHAPTESGAPWRKKSCLSLVTITSPTLLTVLGRMLSSAQFNE